jgi:multidrug resistance efflux pump
VLGADMAAKQRSRDEINAELSGLDAELKSARAGMDVNDPAAAARFRQLLERRDAAFRRSTGLVTGDLGSATARYNQRVNEYNSRCANRPRDPGLLGQVQATLSCPPPY